MRILIQKFGGTSLSSVDGRSSSLKRIIQAKWDGYQVVVVVSAMGRSGEPYATDTLLGLVDNRVREDDLQEIDLLMACGEVISGIVFTSVLRSSGMKASFLTGYQAGIITDNIHGNASILEITPHAILERLSKNQVVVVAGFQGVSKSGEITTLGRGGSDTTACALGVALDADRIEIFTDVDGVHSADPRIVSDTQKLDCIDYEEICQLAHEGAKVIHPRAVELAMQGNVPLTIHSTFQDTEGTIVCSLNEQTKTKHLSKITDRIVTGITSAKNVTQLTVNFGKDDNTNAKNVFSALAAANISIDFINVLPDKVLFTVSRLHVAKAVDVIESLGFTALIKEGCAKIAAVGAGMKGIPGVMARITTALTDHGIKIYQSTDSYASIWCLVNEEDIEKAVIVLHDEFIKKSGGEKNGKEIG